MTQNKSELENQQELEWLDETIPRSVQFDDTYYSKADGYSETIHTFLNGNDLPERFVDAKKFVIGELGFGTGLNFLAAKELWKEKAQPTAKLHFVSFEQYPIEKDQVIKALSRWPQLETATHELANIWTTDREFLDCHFENVELTVFFGDANIRLPQLDLEVDAWFLDGFSPAKNPELWNETLMLAVGKNTVPNGTFATYTSAGFVRRNLAQAGFEVTKQTGHAGKREMSVGKMSS